MQRPFEVSGGLKSSIKFQKGLLSYFRTCMGSWPLSTVTQLTQALVPRLLPTGENDLYKVPRATLGPAVDSSVTLF